MKRWRLNPQNSLHNPKSPKSVWLCSVVCKKSATGWSWLSQASPATFTFPWGRTVCMSALWTSKSSRWTHFFFFLDYTCLVCLKMPLKSQKLMPITFKINSMCTKIWMPFMTSTCIWEKELWNNWMGYLLILSKPGFYDPNKKSSIGNSGACRVFTPPTPKGFFLLLSCCSDVWSIDRAIMTTCGFKGWQHFRLCSRAFSKLRIL